MPQDPQGKRERLVRRVLPDQWEYRVVWVLLVLPVVLVILAVLAQLDPQVRQALLGWLPRWFGKSS